MPRPNKERSTGAEANLARRIQYERERRGLSYEALAKAMTDVGCKIQGSALFKVEKADPPRRITVDELAALAEVFELDVSELLKPMELVEEERAAELLVRLQGRNRELGQLVAHMFNDFVDLAVVWRDDADIYEYVMGHFNRSPLGTETIAARPKALSDPDDGAFDALLFLLTDIAGRAWYAVSQVTLMYMNTLLDRERGQGPSEEELKAWVEEWRERQASGESMPSFDEARERLIGRVEDWVESMRAD